MTKINLITAPDILFGDCSSILLIYPSVAVQNELQHKILNNIDDDLNIYIFNDTVYDEKNVDWLLSVFHSVDFVVVDVDNCQPFIRDLLSYLIAKPKTYWLTKADQCMYNHISNNRIYNFDSIQQIGDISVETKQQPK
jgi:hypothetical protein